MPLRYLCPLMASRSNYRAKDRLGLTLVPIADRYDKEVPVAASKKRCAAQDITEREYARARLSAHYSVKYTYLLASVTRLDIMLRRSDTIRTMRIAQMRSAGADTRRCNFPDLDQVFDHNMVETWTGYPLTMENVPFRPVIYLKERCRLTELFEEIHSLLLLRDEERNVSARQFDSDVHALSTKVLHWFDRLPPELQYKWPMSTAIWELQWVHFSESATASPH